MTTASSYLNSCPSVENVTVEQNTITFDGDDVAFRQEQFSRGAGTVTQSGGLYVVITLAYTPFSNASVTLYKNSGAQRQTTDYTITDGVITLTTEADADDVFIVSYFTVAT